MPVPYSCGSMPKKGFKSITVSERVAKRLQEYKKKLQEKERRTISYADVLEMLLRRMEVILNERD